jgi:RNA-directed DNA polymerase
MGFPKTISYYLSNLCTYNNQLPQGAPTSPALANLAAKKLDYRIDLLLKKLNNKDLCFSYSRYADDITVSFNGKFSIKWLLNILFQIIEEE